LVTIVTSFEALKIACFLATMLNRPMAIAHTAQLADLTFGSPSHFIPFLPVSSCLDLSSFPFFL
jgi:hypothetical protein